MKTHVRNTALGGILLPIALLLAALIANEGQTLIGLELDRVSLAIYLLPFLYGCAEVMKALLQHGVARIGQEFLGALSGSPTEGAAFTSPSAPAPTRESAPPAPPPAPPVSGGGP